MAVRVIRTDDDPILRKKSRDVKEINDRMKELIRDMFETMDEADGVGLAAPQVGILRRIIVIDDRESTRLALINPEIIEKDGNEKGFEGCLSIPGRQGTVERCTHVIVNYLDEDSNEKEIEANDFLARILQHEIDHLNGILYTDRAVEMYEITQEEGDIE
ncbi:peptide deformylase [Peptoniphilus stercorisuis]|uniref:Peptide deformylase n=1 Tax=Peptoniphilus stercorisuis TaxID=1436965 RepID=A0ABS4KDL2_9FIRM|nr:peptide deformylase [Peptoniphilus stercorisuis]MBP2025847.1 peptide deformylase [Peptoniphilus stercorisuis]